MCMIRCQFQFISAIWEPASLWRPGSCNFWISGSVLKAELCHDKNTFCYRRLRLAYRVGLTTAQSSQCNYCLLFKFHETQFLFKSAESALFSQSARTGTYVFLFPDDRILLIPKDYPFYAHFTSNQTHAALSQNGSCFQLPSWTASYQNLRAAMTQVSLDCVV